MNIGDLIGIIYGLTIIVIGIAVISASMLSSEISRKEEDNDSFR
jgi:hypothetical protein